MLAHKTCVMSALAADQAMLQFLRVSYLRQLTKLPSFDEVPRDGQAAHVGAPPSGVDLYKVIHLYLDKDHPDPRGEHLRRLVELLTDAQPADLVFIDWCAVPPSGPQRELMEMKPMFLTFWVTSTMSSSNNFARCSLSRTTF